MKIAFFSNKPYDEMHFDAHNQSHHHDIKYFVTHLNESTASLAHGYPCVCAFVNDTLNQQTLQVLSAGGTQLIALRSAGFNHVDMAAAHALGLTVVRVPTYSPHAVAEHAVGLILALNRKIHRAYWRVRESDFSLEGLLGFDIKGKTVGVVGTGEIGSVFCKIMQGFDAKVIASDIAPNPGIEAMGIEYVDLQSLFKQSDIISLHCPLTDLTYHMIDDKALSMMKKGVMIINTGRGKLIDSKALIKQLKNGHIGAVGLDVYEEEGGVFFDDHRLDILQDDVLARLLTFPNVIITGHQAFFTEEALNNIAETTLSNVTAFEKGEARNTVIPESP